MTLLVSDELFVKLYVHLAFLYKDTEFKLQSFEQLGFKLLHATGRWLPAPTTRMEPRHGIMKAFPKVKRPKVLPAKDVPPLKKKAEERDVKGCYFLFM